MSDIELDYDYLTNNALRRVVADVLKITADLGEAPGEHHFYIEFITGAPGVVMPDDLRAVYPDTMTIVLQHQFENLLINEDGFSVTLWFKGKQADLVIPYDAMASFADPSVQFGMRFESAASNGDDEHNSRSQNGSDEQAPPPHVSDSAAPGDKDNAQDEDTTEDAPTKSDGADVVSLDSFRKK